MRLPARRPVTASPPPPEVPVLHGEFADQAGQPQVVRGCGGRRQMRHAVTGGGPPVGVERPHGGVCERDADAVALVFRHLLEIGQQADASGFQRMHLRCGQAARSGRPSLVMPARVTPLGPHKGGRNLSPG